MVRVQIDNKPIVVMGGLDGNGYILETEEIQNVTTNVGKVVPTKHYLYMIVVQELILMERLLE